VKPKALARALLALSVAGASLSIAQQTPPPPQQPPAPTASPAAAPAAQNPTDTEGEGAPPQAIVIVASGTGAVSGPTAGEAPLPWIETAQGVLVALEPVVTRLGGSLEVGALGASYTLTVGDVAFVLAPGSAAMTRGTDIVSLSQALVASGGSLFVPVDLIEKCYGAVLGATARWDPDGRRLTLARPVARELPVEVSRVHVQGVTTVVLRLPEPIRYRVTKAPSAVEVVPIGDRFLPSTPPPAGDDPYLTALRVEAGRVRFELAPGIEADDYTLSDPFRIVVDLFRPREAPEAAPIGPSTPPVRPRGVHTVVIDPGHGGDETGAIGPGGTMEKDLTLAIARVLADKLRSELGLEVVLTRDDDVAVPLDDRSALANQQKADLFISIHLNSTVAGGRAHGAETYFLSLQASDDRASSLAATENVTGGTPPQPGSEEFDLQLLLWDLAQSRHLEASQRLATLIQQELNKTLDLTDRGVKQAPFRVLMGAAMPAVLVELGFLSNPDEEQKLRDPAYRGELAETLVRAVSRFKAEYEGAGGAPGGAAP
jgi:N-acetylmuramoyl-L-alanine amidase